MLPSIVYYECNHDVYFQVNHRIEDPLLFLYERIPDFPFKNLKLVSVIQNLYLCNMVLIEI